MPSKPNTRKKQPRTHIVKTRLNDEEYARTLCVCNAFGLTVSELLRMTLTHTKIQPVTHVCAVNEETLTLINDLIMQGKRVGNNLNQIAHVANTTGLDDPILMDNLNQTLGELHDWNFEILRKAGEAIGNDQTHKLEKRELRCS